MFSLGKKTLASLMALSVLLSPLSMSLGTLFQTNEIFAQSNYPEIMHMPLMTAPDNINLTVTARMMDRETSTPGDLVSELAYSADNKTTWATTSGSHIGNGYFQFTVSSGATDTNNDIYYYLKVSDLDGNSTCFTGDGEPPASCSPVADLRSSGFYVDIISSAGLTEEIKGTVRDSASSTVKLAGALIFMEGTPWSTTTDSSGRFALTNLPPGPWQLMAATSSYMEGFFNGIPTMASGTGAYTDNYFDLYQGSGGGGIGGNPEVVWHVPQDGMMGAPISIDENMAPIVIGFNQEMSSSTINTTNVKLLKIDPATGNTASPGISYTVAYDSSMMEVKLYSSEELSPNTSYNVELTPAVVSSDGNPLSGNRPGGGHVFMFTTAGGMGDMNNMMTMISGNMDSFSGMFEGKYGEGTNYTDMDAMMTAMQGDQNMFMEMMHGAGGQYMPPFVESTVPMPGSFDVPKETKILIKFSEQMDQAVIISGDYIKMYEVNSDGSIGNAVSVSIALDTQTRTIATITPTNDLQAKKYRVEVLGGAKASSGMTIGPPGQESARFFDFEFESSGTADTEGPVVQGTNLDMYTWDSNNNRYSDIPTNMLFEIGLSEALDESSVNSNSVYIKSGTNKISSTVSYDSSGNTIRVVPNDAFSQNTTYVLTVSASTTDLAGKPLYYTASNTSGTAWSKSFKTGSADSQAPAIEFIDADDYSAFITFSEPMNAAKVTNTTKWPTSVLNPSNYQINSGGGSDPNQWESITFNKATFSYDSSFNVVKIKGIYYIQDGTGCTVDNPCPLLANEGIQVTIAGNGVSDISGNLLSSGASARGTVLSSKETSGMLGPMGGGMMGPSMGPVGWGGHDPKMMMEMPVGVMPMNPIVGKKTLYFIDFPTSKSLQDGDIVVLTFPQGFDVSGAIQDAYSPMNSDMNGPGPGTVTFDSTYGGGDGILADKTARTVKIKLSISGTASLPQNDFLHMDIDGIKNSVTPKDWDTSGYTVNMKSMRSTEVLESMTSMPFFISGGGDYTITGTITASGVDDGQTVRLKLEGPMGPQDPDSDVAFSSGSATYAFSSTTAGHYHLMVEPVVTLEVGGNDTDFFAPMPRPLILPDNVNESGYGYSSGNKTLTYDFSLSNASNGAPLVVNLYGGFGGDDVDVFADSFKGFAVKALSSVGNSVGQNPAATTTIYLPSAGEWRVGIGPAMPKGFGPMTGPPPMPSWAPPTDQQIVVSGSSGNWTVSPSSANFTITTFSQKIIGYVQDASGNMIKGAEVFAHRSAGGFGMPSHATAGRDDETAGKFTLPVGTGMYAVGAFMPGLPPVPEMKVLVKEDSGNVATDGNQYADVYLEGNEVSDMLVTVSTSTNPLILRLQKTDYVIEGYLYDSPEQDAKVVSYAPVWAQSVSSGEMVPAGTDERGKYTLFVRGSQTGVDWNVFAHIPGMGDIAPITVTVQDDDTIGVCSSKVCTKDLRPSAKLGDMAKITGRVYEDTNSNDSWDSGEEITDSHIWIEGIDTSGSYFNFGKMVDSLGRYSLTTPDCNNVSVHAWTGDYGELPLSTTTAVSGQTSTVDFKLVPSAVHTVSVSFNNVTSSGGGVTGAYDGVEAFIDLFDPTTKKGGHLRIDDISSIASHETLQVMEGSNYFVNAFVPGIGEIESDQADALTNQVTIDSSNTALSFTLPAYENLITVSGTVTVVNTATPVADAFVWFDKKASGDRKGMHFGAKTDSSGAYSVNIEKGGYTVGLDAPGYTSSRPSEKTFTDSATLDFSVAANNYSVSGTIYSDTAKTQKIESGWVWAESTDGGWAGTPINGGEYKVSVGESTWTIHAVADGYIEGESAAQCAGSACDVSSPTGVDLVLTAIPNYTPLPPAVKIITPAEGGILDDIRNTGFKVIIPPNAVRTTDQITKSTKLHLIIKESTSVIKSNSQVPLVDASTGREKMVDISLVEPNSGSQVKTFVTPITIEYHYSEDELPDGVSENDLAFNTIDSTTGQFSNYDPTTKKGITYVVDTTNNIIRATVDHLSPFGGSTPPPTAPTAASGLTATSQGSSGIGLVWTDNSSAENGFKIYRNSSDATSTASLVTTVAADVEAYSDSGLSSATLYYYWVVAYNSGGNSWSDSASATTDSVATGGGGGLLPTVYLPPTAPIGGFSVLIDAGKETTNSRDVVLTLNGGTDVAKMAISENSNFSGAVQEDYISSKAWKLSAGDGEKKIYVKFYTEHGQPSSAIFDTIIFQSITEAAEPIELEVETPAIEKPIAQMTVVELKAKIAQLLTQIETLKKQLSELAAEAVEVEGIPAVFKFTKLLKYGQTSEEVKNLQRFLKARGADIYPEGIVSGWFGPLTKKAVIRFQEKYVGEILKPWGLMKGTGLVGKTTRDKINELLGR